MSHDIQVDSRLHATLRARDILAEVERERIESIALALADAEQAAAERLDELRTIRRAHDLLLVELDVVRSERDAARAEVTALRGVDVERANAERAWLAERDDLRKQAADAAELRTALDSERAEAVRARTAERLFAEESAQLRAALKACKAKGAP